MKLQSFYVSVIFSSSDKKVSVVIYTSGEIITWSLRSAVGRPSFLQDTTLHCHNSTHTTLYGTTRHATTRHISTLYNSTLHKLIRQNLTRQNSTRHNSSRQNPTCHNLIRHNSTQTTWL